MILCMSIDEAFNSHHDNSYFFENLRNWRGQL